METLTIVTKNTYDILGRLEKIEKRQSHSQVNGGAMSTYKTISQVEYDAWGQLKKMKLGTAPLEALTYDYNICGWLLGANRDYVKDAATTNYFVFVLGYDKNGVLGSYTRQQYNGNISGMLWKSAGDGERRKYDFDYDNVNRLMNADFGQYDGSAFNTGAGVNFGMHMGNGTDSLTAPKKRQYRKERKGRKGIFSALNISKQKKKEHVQYSSSSSCPPERPPDQIRAGSVFGSGGSPGLFLFTTEVICHEGVRICHEDFLPRRREGTKGVFL